MKILHCCLANFYIDNYGYQENILPKMHKLQGHEVSILASTETYLNNKELGYVEPKCYLNENGIVVNRIRYVTYLPHFLVKKLRIYKGITKIINEFNPDVIFLHDLQFLSIVDIVKYMRVNKNVKLYIDGHTDFINSGRNLISKYLLHKLIYKWCAKKVEPYVKVFYGVLPLRNKFMHEIYDIPLNKIKLLPLGADDTQFDLTKRNSITNNIRKQFNFGIDDFILISGGKIDKRKNIHLLIEAIQRVNKKEIKLLLFGAPDNEMEYELKELLKFNFVNNLGWLETSKIYDYLLLADLGVFPGTHSVLWEQAVGVGLPCIFKRWEGVDHIDLGGNCMFLENDSIDEIKEKILYLFNNREVLNSMREVALTKGIKYFSYYDIASRAIEN